MWKLPKLLTKNFYINFKYCTGVGSENEKKRDSIFHPVPIFSQQFPATPCKIWILSRSMQKFGWIRWKLRSLEGLQWTQSKSGRARHTCFWKQGKFGILVNQYLCEKCFNFHKIGDQNHLENMNYSYALKNQEKVKWWLQESL